MTKAKNNTALIVVGVIVLLVVALFVFGVPQSVVEGDQPKLGSTCDTDITPDLMIKAYDMENPGTALTEATNLYRKVGSKIWSTFTAGTEITDLIPNSEYEFVMGITTSDFTDNAYGEKFTYTIKCLSDDLLEKGMYNDEVETSLTATFYNADASAAAETFVAGDSQVVSIKLKAGVDEVFGNPFLPGNPNVLVLDLNTTEWDAPNQVYLADGTTLNKVTTPQRHAAAAGLQAYAYELPVITDKQIEVMLDLNADDTNAPATDMTAYIYAANWFINGDTTASEFGVENEEGTAVGTDAADSVTLDFTA